MKKGKNERPKDEIKPIEQNEIAQDEDPPCGLPLPCTQSISSTSPAISIENTARSGPADGVFGETNSFDGFGVHGVNNSTGGELINGGGVLGESDRGIGVLGRGVTGIRGEGRPVGVEAVGDLIYSGRLNKLDAADNFTAIVGCADFTMGHSSRRGSPGRALVDGGDSLHINYFDWGTTVVDSRLVVGGNVEAPTVIAGTLIAGLKLFKIDHPVDPANKYLTHACVESAEMMNVYTGNIVLDTNGEAWVELSEWFEALNRDFRYQLTAIGAPAPNLHIAQEIEGNRFKIAGGDPGSKVSWQVTGSRRDPFAEKYSISVEEEKLAEERGYYLHPEVFGQPEEKGIKWARYPK